MLIVECLNAIFGTMVAALLYYKKFVKSLTKHGCKLNPYDGCVANKTVRFLTDFRELNKRLVRKPFPIPKISTVLQELEGFTYATALDLTLETLCHI